MSAYAPPANFNPIFDSKKFISIPTANVNTTGSIYRNDLTIANETLDEATEVLTEFSTSASVPTGLSVPVNVVTPIINNTFAPGCWLWSVNFCCDVGTNYMWSSISIWITTTINGVVKNQQSCNYFNYNTGTQGTLKFPTLNQTFMVNNNTVNNCSAVVNCIINGPASGNVECWFGAVYFGSGYQQGKIIITNQKNPFQV